MGRNIDTWYALMLGASSVVFLQEYAALALLVTGIAAVIADTLEESREPK